MLRRRLLLGLSAWLVCGVPLEPAEAFSARDVSLQAGAALSDVIVDRSVSAVRLAKGELIEGYFPEPGESAESAAANSEAVNARNQRQRIQEVPLSPLPTPENFGLPIVTTPPTPEPLPPDPFLSDTPRRALRPLYKEQTSP